MFGKVEGLELRSLEDVGGFALLPCSYVRVVLQRAPLGDCADVQLKIAAVSIKNLLLLDGERKF